VDRGESLTLRTLAGLLAWIGVLSSPCIAAPARNCAPLAGGPYQGPLFDAMAQTDQSLDGDAAVARAKSAGVSGMALFARVHRRQDGRPLVERLASRYPDFITLGAPKEFNLPIDLPSDYIDEVVSGVSRRHFAFVGEILYTHGDKEGGEITSEGERYTDPTLPGTKKLLDGLGGAGIPVMAHWEVYEWARDWPRFHRVYGAYPGQVFIWPHLGFGSAQQARLVLAADPNVWATVSKRDRDDANLADDDKEEAVGDSMVDECVRLKPEWRELLVSYAGRLMFATDAHKTRRWGRYVSIIQRWRVILGQLPPPVAGAIAHQNAERLYARHPK
jgi:hypothetical protein